MGQEARARLKRGPTFGYGPHVQITLWYVGPIGDWGALFQQRAGEFRA